MIYEVIVDISNGEVDKVFDYSAPFAIPVGSRVLVPFGNRTLEGFVVGVKDSTKIKTKDIIKVLDDFLAINPEMLALTKHLNQTNNLRMVDCLRLCIPSKLRGGKVKELKKSYITLDMQKDEALKLISSRAKSQVAMLEKLYLIGGEYESVLNSEYNPSSVKALVTKGIVKRKFIKVDRTPYKGVVADKKDIELTSDQNDAIEKIMSNEGTFLLHGVTGSGKTEIYMQVIEKLLAEDKTAIMLVPEIGLTPQMMGVFRSRFGDKVGLLHSALSDGERFDEWLRLKRGEAKVALGARSAIFAPIENVGVIIIDEEHDTSYVSESNPRYFTEEIAQFRREFNNAKLILGSATPSLATYKKAISGEYTLVKLPNRVNKRELPDMEIIDMRNEVRSGNTSIFSKKLLSALETTIKKGNQAMLFVNRRGFSSFVRCQKCGYIPKCDNCDVSLTYHKDDNRLKCHYCGKEYYMLTECPVCHSASIGIGRVGTEQVVSEVQRIFPDIKVLRMDFDTTTTKDSYLEILSSFAKNEAQVLVGTQMIVKGHDFENVTLVGVLDADMSLYFSDFRSNEKTFQLITQVAGRAGRQQKQGQVLIQTYNPHHYVFDFSKNYDYEGFFEKEINIRETTKFPPFSKIVRILIKSKDEEKAMVQARICYNEMRELNRENDEIFRVKAMRAPLKKLKSEYRFQVVLWLLSEGEEKILPQIYERVANLKDKNTVMFVEINPTQMT
ncbi:MAG: primosomal protein N' [Clostridia bacterium]